MKNESSLFVSKTGTSPGCVELFGSGPYSPLIQQRFETITLNCVMELKNMEHRVVRLDLSFPEEPSFAICEVFHNDAGEIHHYALNGACITAESPAKIASQLNLMRKATDKPVLLESELERITNSDIAAQLRSS